MDAHDLVVLRKFSQLHEAELAISALEAAHIDAVLRDASYGGFRPEASIAGGGVAVLVRREQFDTANAVLEAPVAEDIGTAWMTCANCGRQMQGTVCAVCDNEDRETFLTPARTGANVDKLRIIGIGIIAGVLAVPWIVDRLKSVSERSVLIALAIGTGALLLIFIYKALMQFDERL